MPPCRRAQGQRSIILQVQRDGRGLPAAVLLHHGDGAGHLRGGGAVRGGQQGGGKVVAVFCPGALFQGEVSGHQLVAGLPCQRGDAGGQAVCHDFVKAVGCHGIAQLRLKKGVQPIGVRCSKPRLGEKKKELRQACKLAREVMERKNKMNARSEKYAFKKGISRMAVNTLKDKAEKSTVRLGDTHEEKMVSLQDSITDLQNAMPGLRGLQTDFNSSNLHIGKILIVAEQINFGYISSSLWQFPMDIQVRSGDRIHISGNNGSGKTTLVKLLLGELEPTVGTIMRTGFSYLYIDQECSVIDPRLTVFEQTERFNTGNWAKHELKSILNRYLFPYDTWDKGCACLSGGEKIRLLFCCLMIGNNAPDVFILDEPTNNLDIQSVEIITAAIKSYRGTVLLISHDHYFVKEIKINRSIKLFDTGSVIKI